MQEDANAQNLRAAWLSLVQTPRADGAGQVFVFTSATTGSGTSFVTRSMAMIASAHFGGAKQVAIVDMDIQNNAQSNWFSSQSVQACYGAPEGPYDACFGEQPFWRVTPSMLGANGYNSADNNFMSLHIVPALNLSFTKFHWQAFKPGQTAHIQNARAYWHRLRSHFGAILVDTPALDRADIIRTVCPEADATVLVSSQSEAKSEALGSTFSKVTNMSARCAGVIFNECPQNALAQGDL